MNQQQREKLHELDFAHDEHVEQMVRDAPPGEITIVELGAWDGYHTEIMARRMLDFGRRFTIHAVEPDPRIFDAFKIHTLAHREHVRFHSVAIGATNDRNAIFWLSTGSHLGSSSIKKPKLHLRAFPDCRFIEARTRVVTLDWLCDALKIERIDFLWADIQGAEAEMIAGGADALRKTRYLYTEHCDSELYDGEIGLCEIVRRLPGAWQLLEDFGNDALLQNKEAH